MNVLVTGASGFLGGHLCDAFKSEQNVQLTACSRKGRSATLGTLFKITSIDSKTNWSRALEGQDVVVHVAARAHIMRDEVDNPLAEYQKVNVDGTLNLARQASLAGVARFIFISSIKVNGERTLLDRPFKPDDRPSPEDAYGISKYQAEAGLIELAKKSGMEVVIIRPPLVYGPGVKANFKSMVSWVRKGIPLPFGMVDNKRSFIAIDNLVDFILLCSDRAKSPKAANQIFLISDGEDVSITTLLRKIAKAYGARSRLVPVPVSFMRTLAKLLRKSDMADRLFGDLQADSSKARELLGWRPVITMDEQLNKMAEFDNVVEKL